MDAVWIRGSIFVSKEAGLLDNEVLVNLHITEMISSHCVVESQDLMHIKLEIECTPAYTLMQFRYSIQYKLWSVQSTY